MAPRRRDRRRRRGHPPRRLPADRRRRRPRAGARRCVRLAHRRHPRADPGARRGGDRGLDRDCAPDRLAHRPHRPARAPRLGDAVRAAAGDPDLRRRLPVRLRPRAERPAPGRAGGRAPALDLRLLRRLARAHAVHLSARPAAGAGDHEAARPAARGGGAGDGPGAARHLPHRGRPPALALARRRRAPGGAVRDQRLRRRLDHALRLVHHRALHLLPLGLRPGRHGRARLGAGDRHGRAALGQLPRPPRPRRPPARPGRRAPGAPLRARALALAGDRLLLADRHRRPDPPDRRPRLLV